MGDSISDLVIQANSHDLVVVNNKQYRQIIARAEKAEKHLLDCRKEINNLLGKLEDSVPKRDVVWTGGGSWCKGPIPPAGCLCEVCRPSRPRGVVGWEW